MLDQQGEDPFKACTLELSRAARMVANGAIQMALILAERKRRFAQQQIDMLKQQPQQQRQDIPSRQDFQTYLDKGMARGDLVKASDLDSDGNPRNNYGKIVDINGEQAKVVFTNKETGKKSTVALNKNHLNVVKPATPTMNKTAAAPQTQTVSKVRQISLNDLIGGQSKTAEYLGVDRAEVRKYINLVKEEQEPENPIPHSMSYQGFQN